ncbi:MAG: amidohydrolase [Candidatus Limimorpha sp.]
MKKALPILLTLLTMVACNKTKVDMIVTNANVYTVDNEFSKVTSFAIKDGHFLDTGNDKYIKRKYEATRTLDARGMSVFPGFIDGHCHFVGYAEHMVRYADLSGCKSFDEVVERLERHNENNDSEWLLGRGWDQNLWTNPVFPDNKIIDRKFPNKKVLLTRIDGHAVLVSSNVIELLEIKKDSNIAGGEVIKDKSGNITGVLLDNAAEMARAAVTPMDKNQSIKALKKAQRDCLAVGLTGVTDAGLDAKTIMLLEELLDNGTLKMKINAMMNPDDATMDYFIGRGIIEKEMLTVRSVKIYADGALGSRGAKLIEPYSDAPETDGIITGSEDFYHKVCKKAFDAGLQVCTHAIGDGGVRTALNLYKEYLGKDNDFRWRIEHSQIVNPEDIDIYGEYRIIPSIQATHCTSDMAWAEQRLGKERIKHAYAYKELLQQNGWIINGTDFPIESISPIYTFFASIARKDFKGNPEGGFQKENALSREDALRSMTIWAAKGYFAEGRKGSIEKGKEADFVILSDDIMTINEMEIPNVKVINTFINGELVY